MKKLLFALLAILSLFLISCNQHYETIEVKYKVIDVRPISLNTKELARLAVLKDLGNDAYYKSYIDAVQYHLILEDPKAYGDYNERRLYRYGPPVYSQLDFVTAQSLARKTKSGKYKLCPEYSNDIVIKGLWAK